MRDRGTSPQTGIVASLPRTSQLSASAKASALQSAAPGKRPLQIQKKARQPSGSSSVLWYNGDFNDVNGLANEQNTIVTQAAVYDNFVVTDAGGWDITSVFSDNLANTNITGAAWEIRTGVSEGNGGTLVASGMTATPVVTPTGRSGFGFTEYMVEVTGLNVHLPALPAGQFYWLNVTPIGDGTGRSFDSSTSGTNCVGTPCGNDQNAFFDSTFFGSVFTSTANVAQPFDFSMGVIGIGGGGGTPTPTPTPGGCSDYTTATWTDTIVPGTLDTGNDCDDCTTPITLPFPVSVYGTSYTTAVVESNGTLQLTGNTAFFTSGCNPLPNANYERTLFPYYDDLRTDDVNTPDCVNFPGGCGVFTSVTGSAPNREFHIEWRTGYFGRPGNANFEVRLFESSTDINVVYGATVDNGSEETSGIQSSSAGPATQFSCGDPTLTNGLEVTYSCAGGGTLNSDANSDVHAGWCWRNVDWLDDHRWFSAAQLYDLS